MRVLLYTPRFAMPDSRCHWQDSETIIIPLPVAQIKDIIKQGIEVPEGQNDLRRQQLRELALLNGTLRENDGLR